MKIATETSEVLNCDVRHRQRLIQGSILDSLKSSWQLAHERDIEEILEDDYGVPPFGLDRPRIERVEIPRSDPAWPYLNCHNHDGGVFSVDVHEDALVIKMNDYEAWRFAGALDEWRGTAAERAQGTRRTFSLHEPSLPVELIFEGLRELAFFQSEVNGKLIQLKHSLNSNLKKVNEFAYDWVVKFGEDGISAIFEIRLFPSRCTKVYEGTGWPKVSAWQEHDLYIAVSAARLDVVELQRKAWLARYGDGDAWLWDEFAIARCNGHLGGSGWDEVVAFVDQLHKKAAGGKDQTLQ